ncbi:tachylectin-related carbohydrate-binding protein [Actinoplanes sp. Pm04-4]|uniref:Tachylectin-related carbohydrate-binding protein n=1 Tax=Paractinoplanes pyxinae TaxID=2997416 RepID=A0ABT4BD94_9ACTN|nr:tachylectin-related carbohydrate-binding protein [Actinoplanes pyxinae]MCY1143578.1 tachylectin-related carbohydrate-binding protein [Actinoplanes pyxinae]
MRILLAVATVLAALTVGATPAHAAATAPCVDGGPTAADNAAATRLNSVLTGTLRNAMTGYRVSCARAVITAVQRRGLTERAAVIAITTTIVESTIRNTSEKLDHDSLGLFQQRDSWGTEAQRLDPAWATNAFLSNMQSRYPNGSWASAPIGEVCQAVQRSEYPARYQPEAADAQRIVDELSGPAAVAVSVYGALDDGRLTYSVINSDTGNRSKTVVSTDTIGFTPVAMATLNFNTILVTSPDGGLYRIDVITNNTSLQFTVSDRIEGGWTHQLLTYDGHGHLYGVANGKLISYVVSRAKPGADQIGQRHEIGEGGFALKNLTATGDDWLLGVSNSGELRSYRIGADYKWSGATLATRWSGFDQLVSPGYGFYYGRTPAGAMYHYFDHNPYDLNGSDLQYYTDDPVDTRGWTQKLLSAQPLSS